MTLGEIWRAALSMLVFLYPLCLWYRRYQCGHRDTRVRFI